MRIWVTPPSKTLRVALMAVEDKETLEWKDEEGEEDWLQP